MKNTGEYGGLVLRDINTSQGVIKKGTVLTPEDASSWPLANRVALETAKKVTWYGPPSPLEDQARNQGAPAPRRRTTTVQETPAPAPSARRRAR